VLKITFAVPNIFCSLLQGFFSKNFDKILHSWNILKVFQLWPFGLHGGGSTLEC
jgi:hypothetical protein